jgi:hypothetical protein
MLSDLIASLGTPAGRRTLVWRVIGPLMTLYPPYLGAGIDVARTADGRGYVARMPLRWYNRNIVGTHFGGSLYAMVDPFFMAILMERLGTNYVVWDKAAEIRFRRPGLGVVSATFEIPDASVEAIRAEAASAPSVERWFEVDVVNTSGEVVATARKLVHVRQRASGRA